MSDTSVRLRGRGKVRDIYEWEEDLLLVASDRISTYDVVMPTLVPDKGKVLNRMSEFWFELTADIVPNHFLSNDVPEEVMDRAMRVRRLEMYPVECVVRGYLSGSGWKEYREGGAVCGRVRFRPSGLLRWTPTHDSRPLRARLASRPASAYPAVPGRSPPSSCWVGSAPTPT